MHSPAACVKEDDGKGTLRLGVLEASTTWLGLLPTSHPRPSKPPGYPAQHHPAHHPGGGYGVLVLHSASADSTVGLPEPHSVVIARGSQDDRVTAHSAWGGVHGAADGKNIACTGPES